MGNFGRFVCVALPFALTLASLVAMLIAGLAGVADKNLYMFQVNTTGLSISPNSIQKLVGSTVGNNLPANIQLPNQGNLSAADLSLHKLYDVSLWGYCFTPQNGPRDCTKTAFNWAETAMGSTTSQVQAAASATGKNVTLPKEITDAVVAFGSVTRWTEIVFIIAYICLGVELFFGIFANCSRAWSCVTWIVAGLATTAVCAAASLATAMSVIVVGSVEGTAKIYGVKGSFNTRFLAAVWIGAAFAIAAGFFWLFTICCCKPEHRQHGSKKRHAEDQEKLIPGAYQPIHDQHNGFYNRAPQYGAPRYPSGGRSDLAYEPYSHGRV